jgi:hypothetical protein
MNQSINQPINQSTIRFVVQVMVMVYGMLNAVLFVPVVLYMIGPQSQAKHPEPAVKYAPRDQSPASSPQADPSGHCVSGLDPPTLSVLDLGEGNT